MFDSKQKSLFEVTSKNKPATSAFVNAALKKGAETLSGNGALKYSSTGSALVDQFGVMGKFKAPRSFQDISRDAELLWADDKWDAVAFSVFVRMISRQTMYQDGTMTSVSQKGGELRHEGIMRFLWLHFKDEKTFWTNVGLMISAGSWKDIFTMLSYDLVHHGWNGRKLNWKKFGELILSGLENSNTSDLIKKYLPQIKAKSSCKTVEAQADTIIAKWICSLVFGTKENAGSTYKQYRKLKTSGTAHEWQKLISTKQFDRIDFNKVHGRALSKLVQGKFLFNQKLSDKYAEWIKAPETKEVKYTGFVHELFEGLGKRARRKVTSQEEETINKQFATLVKKGGETGQTSLIVVRDTSGSMSSPATGTTMSCYDIAKALALYFSEFLTGRFADAWIEFNSDAQMHTWKGQTPVDKWKNDHSSYVGGTNFQSVINLFVNLKQKGISEEDFPTGILCISDSEFNPTSLGKTNVETAKETLRRAGFSKEYVDNFVIVLWNLQSGYYGRGTGEKFETYGDVKNVFYFSGYSATTVGFLTNTKIKTAEELVREALSQELIQRVEVL
jgi:hypothetical protein